MNEKKSSSDSSRPLYIWPRDCDLTELKQSVIELNLPFMVKPFWFDGSAGDRVIALDDGFTLMTSHAYPKSNDARKKAVLWALGLDELPQARTTLDKMRNIFGEGVTEIVDED